MELVNSEQIRQNCKSKFFAPDTMKFWNSRLLPTACMVSGVGLYFVTSERPDRSLPRRYTIRLWTNEGVISTISEFGEYETSRAAFRALKKMLSE
jgi:hypothetical protein